MPKKSNKTDHVLSLLTGGFREEASSQDKPPKSPARSNVQPIPIQNIEDSNAQAQTGMQFTIAPKPSPRVVVEESKAREDLSQLVRLGLEKEINISCKPRAEHKPFVVLDEDKMGEFNFPDEAITEVYSEDDMEFVTSRPFVLENFNEDEDLIMNNENPNAKLSTEPVENPEEILHNLAEDVMKTKAVSIMESMNMCTCQSCIYDVIALALNNTKPLYTVTKKGELFQKLASCEMQYGADIAREITRACLKIKLNPRHEGPSQEQ